MAAPASDRNSVPAVTGVQPDAPNATHAADHDLAEGPPATDDEATLEPIDEG